MLKQLALYILSSLVLPPSATPNTDAPRRSTRTKKCPSCHVPHTEHHFGPPGPTCEGQHRLTDQHDNDSATISNPPNKSDQADSGQVHFFREQLAQLQSEEQELRKSIEEEEQQLIAASQASMMDYFDKCFKEM